MLVPQGPKEGRLLQRLSIRAKLLLGVALLSAVALTMGYLGLSGASSAVLLGFGIPSIAVAIAVSLLATASTSGSLRRIGHSLEEVASGAADLSKRLPVTGQDEVGALAASFNKVMGNLEELVRQVKLSGIQVTSSTTQIAAEARQLEATVNEQAASTRQVAASAQEISSTSHQLLDSMTSVASLSEQAAWAAGVGRQNLEEMQATMAAIEAASTTVAERLAAINEKATNISAVVTTITKVAEQTNMLSLNAAIEAEKAGEYGKGFAVVAREIRRLADQTAVATLDIERMVKEMKGAVASGVMSMDKFSEQVREAVGTATTVTGQLGDVIGHVDSLNPQLEAAVQAMQGQAEGAREISEAMQQIGAGAEQTATSLRQSGEAIRSLNEAARGLQAQFGRFTVG